jgi:SagB-type dehydrogenase family enzyme
MSFLQTLVAVACLFLLALAAPPGSTVTPPTGSETIVHLPSPDTEGGPPLAEVLAARRSVRSFAKTALSPEQIGQLCWAAQGITDPAHGFRTAPSAGALYPVTIYIVQSDGVFEYLPREHVLRRTADADRRRRLESAALGQSSIGDAPVCLVVTVDVSRTARKYGSRAERYCLIEAGHVAQNVLLQATALELGGVPVGAFDDQGVAQVLDLPDRLRPVYLLPIGSPRSL